MKKILISIIFFLPTICWGLAGTVHNNIYVSPNGDLSVTVPPVSNVQITDGSHGGISYVDFFPKKYVSYSDISYSLDWYTLPNQQKNIATILKQLPQQMLTNTQPSPMTIDQCTIIKDASQCIATIHLKSISMKFIGTRFISKNHIIDAYMMVPMTETTQALPWKTYNQLMKSISINNSHH